MAFKLQITDEMSRFFRSDNLSDTDAGKLIRLLLDEVDGLSSSREIPQPLTFTLPIFIGQIERFRDEYERKKDQATARKRAQLDRERGFTREQREESTSRVNSVNDSITREQREQRSSLHTIPIQSITPTLTSGGGSAEHSTETTTTVKFQSRVWARNDYACLAAGMGWPEDEIKRFCDYNDSGRMNPADALSAWNRNRTPTEAAGGAAALATRAERAKAVDEAYTTELDSFKRLIKAQGAKSTVLEPCIRDAKAQCRKEFHLLITETFTRIYNEALESERKPS